MRCLTLCELQHRAGKGGGNSLLAVLWLSLVPDQGRGGERTRQGKGQSKGSPGQTLVYFTL